MKLNLAKKKVIYQVENLIGSEQETSRFFKLGIYPGAMITLKRKAPLFLDPIVFQVDESQIVMTKSEASLVEVKEMEA